MQLKQLTRTTTQVTLSTSVLAGTLASGCRLMPHEGDTHEFDEDDSVDAAAETLHLSEAEAQSLAYTQVPADRQPIVMPLELEDSPTTPPPASALADAPAARPERSALLLRAVHRPRRSEPALELDTGDEVDADAVTAATTVKVSGTDGAQAPADPRDPDGCAAAYTQSMDAAARASRRAHAQRTRTHRDPIGESFLPTVSSQSALQSTLAGPARY